LAFVRRSVRRRIASLSGLLLVFVLGSVSSAFAASTPEIKVLSNRADLISGGDALVQVVGGTTGSVSANSVGVLGNLTIKLNGVDVTNVFAMGSEGRFMGLLKNLSLGDNVVTASAPGGKPVSLKIINHSIGGPVLSGPQIQPWTCFAGALDKQCNRPPAITYLYKSTSGGALKAYDPGSPPSDVATTTTDQGKTVPFIVRQEVGAIDRDEYRIAILYDPSKPWSPVAPQDGFNHKLVIFHGASCDTAYTQAAANDVLNETALGAGFATMSHALNNAGHNCNIVTQAESMIMTKEHLIDTYGTIRYTIGSGCSGGSLVQQQVANAFPGLYQGITPQCSFTDAWSSAMQYEDYVMMRRYLENPTVWGTGVLWLPHQIQAIEGHINPANPITFTEVIPNSGNPTRSCPGLSMDQVFDQDTNPKGVRCSLQDYMVNVFGKRAQDGYAQRPFDNVGIQYGLKALLDGTITPTQFVDLNAKIGSVDINFNPTIERTEADRPALERIYRSGAVNQADNLDKVAIIDLRGPDPGAFHDVYRTYVMRARLDRNFHTHANQVLWRGLVALMGDVNYKDEAILAVDKWLAVVEKDTRDISLAEKIIKDKPSDVTDRCTNGAGVALPANVCDNLVTPYSDPRLVAGMPMTDDTTKCELKPLSRSAYGSATFTDGQWAQLQKTFPQGVCDYTKPGVDRVPTVPWLTYQDHAGNVIYGGKPLGAVPTAKRVAPLSLRASRTCVSARRLSLRLVAAGEALRSARVYVNGKSRSSLRGKALTRTLALRGLPRGTVRVKVVGVTKSGKRVTAQQRYRACAAKSRRR
jgi:hypothetical protein